MNANVSESNVIVDEAIVQPNIKEKVEVRKVLYKVVKRLIDILGGLVGGVLLIPITVAIYIARKILKEDDGPMFYEQLRLGKDGKHFKLYKYRSMIIGADEILKEYLANNEEARIEFEKNQKLRNDPRITKLGNFLRKTSLDEFPQFINILKGDMSLVGTRPPTIDEFEKYESHHKRRLSMKPGITGKWQVSGRSNIKNFEDVVKLDCEYIDEWSPILDIQILIKTVGVVLTHKGAE